MTVPPRLSLIHLAFTPAEWEMIAHRLAVPDCIAEALADYDEGTPEQIVADAARLLANGPNLLLSSRRERLIIEDCVDGSTWFGNLEKGTPEYAAASQHARNIEHKVAYHFGEACHFPRS